MSTDRTFGRLLAALVTFAFAAAAQAETHRLGEVRVEVPAGKDYDACFERADGNDLDMAACKRDEFEAWDRRLNAAWARLKATLSPAEFARLQAAQRGWIAYRDHECRDDETGGTAGRVAAASCLVRVTATRAGELEARAAAR
jgi:uncharacterized protein YecT (DUF1311 family)